jgi:hypothetical protein
VPPHPSRGDGEGFLPEWWHGGGCSWFRRRGQVKPRKGTVGGVAVKRSSWAGSNFLFGTGELWGRGLNATSLFSHDQVEGEHSSNRPTRKAKKTSQDGERRAFGGRARGAGFERLQALQPAIGRGWPVNALRKRPGSPRSGPC